MGGMGGGDKIKPNQSKENHNKRKREGTVTAQKKTVSGSGKVSDVRSDCIR